MNDFCKYCTGNKTKEIRECKDKNCPFYLHRRANLKWQEQKHG